MAEPDELYTLRAQFWLGHYQMAMDEGKSIARRPMSPQLKAEREEFVARCAIAMKDYSKVISGDTPGKYHDRVELYAMKRGMSIFHQRRVPMNDRRVCHCSLSYFITLTRRYDQNYTRQLCKP